MPRTRRQKGAAPSNNFSTGISQPPPAANTASSTQSVAVSSQPTPSSSSEPPADTTIEAPPENLKDTETAVIEFLEGLIGFLDCEADDCIGQYMSGTYLVETYLETLISEFEEEVDRQTALCIKLRTAMVNCRRRIQHNDDDDKLHAAVRRYFVHIRANLPNLSRRQPNFEYTVRLLRTLQHVRGTRDEEAYVEVLSRVNDMLAEVFGTATTGTEPPSAVEDLTIVPEERAAHTCVRSYRSSYCLFCMLENPSKRLKMSAPDS